MAGGRGRQGERPFTWPQLIYGREKSCLANNDKCMTPDQDCAREVRLPEDQEPREDAMDECESPDVESLREEIRETQEELARVQQENQVLPQKAVAISSLPCCPSGTALRMPIDTVRISKDQWPRPRRSVPSSS